MLEVLLWWSGSSWDWLNWHFLGTVGAGKIIKWRENICKYVKTNQHRDNPGLKSAVPQKAGSFSHTPIQLGPPDRQFRELKLNLTAYEAVLHIDFSENCACKMNTEIQAYHFGGSWKQATLHTTVLYTLHSTRSYATLSDSLRHDERAVWAHLEPILRELRTTWPQISFTCHQWWSCYTV